MTRRWSMAPTAAMGICALTISGVATGAEWGAESLTKLQFVSDAQISPDGSRIAYVVTRIDAARDVYDSDLWLIEGENEPRPIATRADVYQQPRWAPDGRQIAFVSVRDGRRQIFVLDSTSGEAWPLTDETGGVGAFTWSNDGAHIAYLAGQAPEETPAPKRTGAGRASITEKLFFRVDGSPRFIPEKRSQLFAIATSPNRHLRAGPLTDGNTQLSSPAWSADSQSIVFSSLPGSDDAAIDRDTELYRVRIDGTGAPEVLTTRRGPDDGPIVSGRSGLIAWTGYDIAEERASSVTRQLYVMRSDLSGRRSLTAEFDRNVTETLVTDATAPATSGTQFAFTDRGRALLFAAADHGRTHLYRVSTEGGPVRLLTPELQGDLSEFSVARDGRIAAIFGSPATPYELWTLDRPGGKWRRRTTHGLSSLPGVELASYESLSFSSFDGQPIQGWLIKPARFDGSRRYPLILYVHGGPHSSYGEAFFHEFEVLADAGYLILIVNPRGSTGYGQEFANRIQYLYPGDDYRDLMAAVDAVQKRDFVDGSRLGIAGGSGGGILTSWTIGFTDRFSAALVERPVVNWLSMAMASDRGAFIIRHWFRDYPWRDVDDYVRRSPFMYVDRVVTPVLVIQSEQDFRAPVDQGVQYYNALRMLGKDARLALFPDSGHGLWYGGPPGQRVQRLELIVGWFDSKLKAAPRHAETSGRPTLN